MQALSSQQSPQEDLERIKMCPLSSKKIITMSPNPISNKIMMMIFWILRKLLTSLKNRIIQTSIRRKFKRNFRRESGQKFSKRNLTVYQHFHLGRNKRKIMKQILLIYQYKVDFLRYKIIAKRKTSKNRQKMYPMKQRRKFDFSSISEQPYTFFVNSQYSLILFDHITQGTLLKFSAKFYSNQGSPKYFSIIIFSS